MISSAKWLPLLILALMATDHHASAAEIQVQGQRFTLDDRPYDMWGIRVASGSQTQELTDHLIAQLDDYRAHGVNTIAVYYMGSSGGYSDPFSSDGRRMDPDHQARMESIIKACDERGMVVVVGIFYQRCEQPQLHDWEACRQAVQTVAKALRPHRNVILNMANEQNSNRYRNFPWSRVREVADLLDLCQIAKEADPRRIVGAGGYDHDKNEQLGQSEHVDVLLFDTAGSEPSSGELHNRFVKAGITNKPLVNVETFGAWTERFQPRGVFPDEARQAYQREVNEAAALEGLSVFFHNNPWCQPTPPGQVRYDLAGSGTKDDPGIGWYFDVVKTRSK
jgi:hypothetical protein